jgi:hypothetical protein
MFTVPPEFLTGYGYYYWRHAGTRLREESLTCPDLAGVSHKPRSEVKEMAVPRKTSETTEQQKEGQTAFFRKGEEGVCGAVEKVQSAVIEDPPGRTQFDGVRAQKLTSASSQVTILLLLNKLGDYW